MKLQGKISILKIEDLDYPMKLKQIKNPPEKLYVIGNKDILNNVCFAIVGSRDCDDYGKIHAKRFASFLAQKNLTIVSGLARGIDTYAHESSYLKSGKTIGVIASGFNKLYPKENIRLAQKIIDNGGAIISECDPDKEATTEMFPKRNRIISGLSIGTLVVESKFRSGSNITAHDAMKQRRDVFCIPGDVNQSRSVGCNRLIKEGANLVTTPVDIIEYYEVYGYKFNGELKEVSDEYKDVYDLIGNNPISEYDIANQLDCRIDIVKQKLFILKLDKFIKKDENGYKLS